MAKINKVKIFTFVSRFGTIVKIRARAKLYEGMVVDPGTWLLNSKQAWKVQLMLSDEWHMREDATFYASTHKEAGKPVRGYLTENILPSTDESTATWHNLMRKLRADLHAQGTDWDSLSVQDRELHKMAVHEVWLQWHQQRTLELRKQDRATA